MALIELNDEEQWGIADVVNGTMDSMMQDVEWDDPAVQYWIDILAKMGERGQTYADAWAKERDSALNS